MKTIVCLGVEPLAFGPFDTDEDVSDELEMHIGQDGYCPNGIEKNDHHILDLQPGFFSQQDDWDEDEQV